MQSTQRSTTSTKRCRGDQGASLVEYALLLALIAVVCVGAITLLGVATKSNFDDSADSIIVAN
jgi:pilus assembly protein Flp/PilA